MRPLRASCLLPVLLLALAGCSRTQPPIVKLEGARMVKLGLAGSSMELRFRVQNPNTKPLRGERFEYEVSINDVPLGRGFYPEPVQVDAFRDVEVKAPFELSMFSIPATIKAIRDRGEARARVSGYFHVRGLLGTRRLPFRTESLVDLPGGDAPRPAPTSAPTAPPASPRAAPLGPRPRGGSRP